MVERSIAWLVTGGNRNVRYRGITNNHAWLRNRTAALNLRRLLNLGLTRNRRDLGHLQQPDIDPRGPQNPYSASIHGHNQPSTDPK